jgi:type IV pilus biogenesis protein CpaD/CtpE
VALNPLDWLRAIRAIDRFLQLGEKHTALLEAQAKEIQDLKDRVTRLEAREEVLIAEAKGAAAVAASAVASQHVAELARQVGAMDERTRQFGRLTAPPPPRSEISS